MRESVRKLRLTYLLSDYISTLGGVALFTLLRFYIIPGIKEVYTSASHFFMSGGVVFTIALFPLVMMLLYYLSGYYEQVYNKSRVKEFLSTLASTVLGAIVFFMAVLLNDVLPLRIYNYEVLLMLFVCLFCVVYMARLVLTTVLKHRTMAAGRERRIVLVARRKSVDGCVARLASVMKDEGMKVSAFVNTAVADETSCNTCVPEINYADLPSLVAERKVDGFVLCMGEEDNASMLRVVNRLFPLDCPIYVTPDECGLVTANVRYENVLADPLVDISRSDMPGNVLAIKRFCDIVCASIGLVVVSPVILALGIIIKRQSPGPVFYSQERIGYHKRPFRIYKLRSMVAESEPDGPQLSSDEDPRVTRIGHFMRKYRLDELPNLWNVIRGDMSVVGPRPEREYFIKQILPHAPYYTLLHQVRPGLTSWGMVKYGYASSVDEMIARFKYDLLYIQNISLSLDIKIMFYTVRTILKGEGK